MSRRPPPRAPRIRSGPIPSDVLLVVRGDDLDAGIARRQAEAFRRRFPDWGRYGLSALLATDAAEVGDLAAGQLERFPFLLILRTADLRMAGFELVPTFRAPHVTIAFGGDLDERLSALRLLRAQRRTNSYHVSVPKAIDEEGDG